MNDNFRYEIKFVLNEREYSHALSWMTAIGVKKPFPNRTVNSLYFDNIFQESVKTNLAGISKRNKTRLRWYGNDYSSAIQPVLEVKSREGRLGSKLAFKMPFSTSSLKSKKLSDISKDILNEALLNSNSFNGLQDYIVPMLLVKYAREYYENFEGIRITVDKKIQFFQTVQNQTLASLKPVNYSNYVVEIKFPQNLKNNVADILRPLQLTPKRHSKYLTGLSILGYTKYI